MHLRPRAKALAAALSAALCAALLAGCATPPTARNSSAPTELTLLSINDFHGNIQAARPTPLMPRLPDATTGEVKAQPAGGVAHLATALADLKARSPNALIVAGGDLIGASPLISNLLRDEPTLAAMSQLGISASALGNHELDAGLPELLRQTRGECAASGCLWPGYQGPGFPYLGANVLDAKTGKPLLPTHVHEAGRRPQGRRSPGSRRWKRLSASSSPSASKGIRFADEADTLNALVPQLKAEGAQVLVAVMHEGGVQDPGRQCQRSRAYACPTLTRPRAGHRQTTRSLPTPSSSAATPTSGLHLQDRRPAGRAGRQLRRLDHRESPQVRCQRPRASMPRPSTARCCNRSMRPTPRWPRWSRSAAALTDAARNKPVGHPEAGRRAQFRQGTLWRRGTRGT